MCNASGSRWWIFSHDVCFVSCRKTVRLDLAGSGVLNSLHRQIGIWYELRIYRDIAGSERCVSAVSAICSGTGGNWRASKNWRRVRPSMATSSTSCAITKEEEVTAHQSRRPVNRSTEPLPLATTATKTWVLFFYLFLVKEKFPSVFSNVVSRRNLRYLRVQIWRTLSAQSARLCQFIAGIKMNRHDDDPEPETQQKRGLKNKGLENNKNRSAFCSFLLMLCYCQPFNLATTSKKETWPAELWNFPWRPICIMICFGSFLYIFIVVCCSYIPRAVWCSRWLLRPQTNRTRFPPIH